jgi:hypothetical protein
MENSWVIVYYAYAGFLVWLDILLFSLDCVLFILGYCVCNGFFGTLYLSRFLVPDDWGRIVLRFCDVFYLLYVRYIAELISSSTESSTY